MNKVTRLVISSLCAALTLGSCTKKHHQPEEPLKAPLDFTAVSQNSALKSGATKATTPLSAFHGDFGAWGIARQEGNPTPYILWESNAMSQVVKSTDNTYVPVADAYWLTGFAYNFIAVAPYTDGISGLAVTPSTDAQTGKDAITFTFDQGAKYTAGDFDFDLMGAVAATDAITTKPTTQPLTFWHLFSQININVSFVDANGTALSTGTVSQMRLCNVKSKADYTLTFGGANNLSVACGSHTDDKTISLSGSSATVHILPQSITGFELYLDFTLDGAAFNDFKVNLNTTGHPTTYNWNEVYNWNIIIGPKADISFSFTVIPWYGVPVGDEIPII
jgi:hypothetical protein